jgi:hypothetical protein
VSAETAAYFPGDVQLGTSEGARSCDGIPRAGVSRGFHLKQVQRPLGAVGRPRRDGAPVIGAQRLRRPHPHMVYITAVRDALGGS